MIFDLLVYAYNNDSIQEVSEVLKKVLLLSDETIINFSDKILEDNSNEFIRILMKWSDDAVRDCTSKILSTAVNRMFGRIDLIEKAEAFMMNMINVIHTQAATNWTKFEHFFNLIKTVAIGGEPQLKFMKKHQIETLLLLFQCRKKSYKTIKRKENVNGKFLNKTNVWFTYANNMIFMKAYRYKS